MIGIVEPRIRAPQYKISGCVLSYPLKSHKCALLGDLIMCAYTAKKTPLDAFITPANPIANASIVPLFLGLYNSMARAYTA